MLGFGMVYLPPPGLYTMLRAGLIGHKLVERMTKVRMRLLPEVLSVLLCSGRAIKQFNVLIKVGNVPWSEALF